LPCTPGKYNDGTGAPCKRCTEGQYAEEVARNRTCDNCAKGQYQPKNGTTACLDCIPGQYQTDTKKETCVDCAVGRASSSVARGTECDACTQGRYQSKIGTTAC
jgi:hypothetical protein